MSGFSLNSLTRQQRQLVLGAVAAVVSLVLLFTLYLPAGSRLRAKGRELSSLKEELVDARGVFDRMADGDAGFISLAEKNEIPLVMDEISSVGKTLDIDFRSIKPQGLDDSDPYFDRVPVVMAVESSYKNLGLFMGSFRELKRGFVRVDRFSIERDDEILPLVRCQLVVHLFVSQ